jgi:esterase/lipase
MKFILIILTSIPFLAFGQFNPKHIDEFQHKTIIINNDTIKYHIYSKGKIGDKSKILFFFQGSGPKPLFQKGTFIDTLKVNVDGEIKKEIKNSTWFGTSVPVNLDKIPEEYLFVVISKKGVPFLDIDNQFKPNQLYYENEGLNYRVWQGDKVIKDITKKLLKKPEKIVILGHSEGSDVVAKLGHTNKKVTHIGYWAGGANTQYYEYALMIQKSVLKGEMTQEEGLKEIDSLFSEIKNIQNEPKNTSKEWWGNTYRRWSQFTEPPIDNLLKIEKPIYIAVGAKDKSVPFESSLLIPIEFIRHNKNNLTFKMFPNYNHSFAIEPKTENEKIVREFMNVFEDFMRWVEQ